MLQLREKIPYVTSDTDIVGAYMQLSGCNCSCVDCNGCKDCVYCVNLSITDVVMNVYRKGLTPDKQYFVQYSAYQIGGVDSHGTPLTGNQVLFFVDDVLKEAPSGYYVGDVFVRGNPCGSIELHVGDNNTVFSPYTQ